MNALNWLNADHDRIHKLLKTYGRLRSPNPARKLALFQQLRGELAAHAELLSKIFYPAVRELTGQNSRDLVVEGEQGLRMVDQLLQTLQNLSTKDPAFDITMKILRHHVEHHARREEDLSAVARTLGKEHLKVLGEEMEFLTMTMGRAA